MVGLAGGILVLPALRLLISLQAPDSLAQFGTDYRLYREAALRWLDGGSYFAPTQLASAHQLAGGDVLYPPVALWLLVPFTVLPAVLWWAIPLALFAWVLWRLRPSGWALPAMAALVAMPVSTGIYWLGQPTIWLPPLIGLGLIRGGWAVFALIKPSLFPFAMAGIRRRWWWITLGVFGLLCVPFGSMWLDWLTAVGNSGGGPLYSLNQVPLLLVPVVAWAGRRRDASRPPRYPAADVASDSA